MQAPQPVRMRDPSIAPWYFQTSRAVLRLGPARPALAQECALTPL